MKAHTLCRQRDHRDKGKAKVIEGGEQAAKKPSKSILSKAASKMAGIGDYFSEQHHFVTNNSIPKVWSKGDYLLSPTIPCVALKTCIDFNRDRAREQREKLDVPMKGASERSQIYAFGPNKHASTLAKKLEPPKPPPRRLRFRNPRWE